MEITAQRIEVSFSWKKAVWGYKWENAVPCSLWGEPLDTMEPDERKQYDDEASSAPAGPFLMEKHPSMAFVPYAPFENPLLFAQFADIAPTEESFLDWANEHGRLRDAEKNGTYTFLRFLSPFTPRSEEELDGIEFCERYRFTERDGQYYLIAKPDPLTFWEIEHRDLSFAVLLWELASNNDPRLNKILKWNEDTRRVYVYPFDRGNFDTIDLDGLNKDEGDLQRSVLPPRRIEHYHPEKYDVRKAALRYIQQEINRKFAAYPLNTRLEIDENEQPHYIHEPTSLLSSMWYQLFLAQMGKIQLKRCSICGRWENMEGHRESWKKHATCANYDRVKRARNKKKGKILSDTDE